MAYLKDLFTELESVAADAVGLRIPPTPNKRNRFTEMQGVVKNFVTAVNNQQYSLPLIVVQVGKEMADLEFGLDNWAQKRIPVTIYYVSALGVDVGGSQDNVDDQARKIMLAIDNPANVFETFGAFESGEVYSDLDNPINKALLADSKVPIISAFVRWNPGFLVNFQLPG